MRPFLFVATMLFLSCSGNHEASDLRSDPAHTEQKPTSDGSYERFMDSIVYIHGIKFGTEPIEAHYVFVPDDNGDTVVPADRIAIGKTNCMLSGMVCVNNIQCGTNYCYEIDTAIAFSLAGKRYAYLRGSIYNYVGVFHFIYDYQYRRLHLFEMYRVPELNNYYFGDINFDGGLDLLAVQSNYIVPQTPADTIETVLLTYYTLNSEGYFEAKKHGSGKDNILIGQYNGSVHAPRNFRVIGEFWR